ncbi:mitochondrial fission ELM1 family protein [Pseudomarimonas salicorniae]|uniref:Mitochondrial fission ELM1 family protein n=1 Tax=Pseudomarimonas salicorniae TaxID=2933270 RepID=A0ABT0GE92_9GAMM|nr:mitochondrial fission ELM1 family protein [Lysobacter sp. CAU 1642]MCK7592879.1 mitochondrial fission ELM1 family protein [Lysobacter sp. CAU 1642]
MLILAVSDGRAGNRRQATALAGAVAALLGARCEHHALSPRPPWRTLAPRWLPYAALGFDRDWLARLDDQRPALVIGCGRQAALATRIARHRLGVATRCVQILDPRLGRNAWDLLVLPEHDDFRDEFTVTCRGSLHGIDADWLAAARARHPGIGALPGPRHVLLLGGPTEDCPWTVEDALGWVRTLRDWRQRRGGSALLIAAPRTPAERVSALRAACSDLDLSWFDPTDGENPYAGALAFADALLVSPDSANLLSEACATEAPVRLPPAPAQQGRLRRLHEALIAARRVAWLDDALPEGPQVPLRETSRVAREVIRALGLRQASVEA